MTPGRIALLHLALVPGALERNRSLIVQAVKQASAAGAQWIFTPELAVCGLQFAHAIGTGWIEPQPDAWMRRFCRLVKEVQRTVFLSCPERDGPRLYNSVFVINPSGDIVGRHRKVHVASDSLSWSSPGQSVAPIACDGISVGVLICSDVYTAALPAALKSQGARILISPASWGPGIHGPDGEWEARTRETGLPLIVCNRTGPEKTLDFRKAPSLVVTGGDRLLAHTSDRSAVLTCDWDFTIMKPLSAAYHAQFL
jgi:5-aminopentanamidase